MAVSFVPGVSCGLVSVARCAEKRKRHRRVRTRLFPAASLAVLPGGDEADERGDGPLTVLDGHRLGADPVDAESPWPAAVFVSGMWRGLCAPRACRRTAATLEIRIWGGLLMPPVADTSEIAVQGRFFTHRARER
jgi:hypothetical protein